MGNNGWEEADVLSLLLAVLYCATRISGLETCISIRGKTMKAKRTVQPLLVSGWTLSARALLRYAFFLPSHVVAHE